ncbi:hypothetical protein CIK05_15835 [Bdellovibrio sp. qaytius]|nr:hypothetical protein CIK05_15835 [Bdellovibrio sp. qaytius]
MRALSVLLFFIFFSTFTTAFAQSDYTFKQRYVGEFQFIQEDKFKTVNNLSPYQRKTFDMKVIEAEYEIQLNPNNKFEFEVEYEHGGTGSAIEFDNFEEFGEFETETEKGGEVAVNEAFLLKKITPQTELYIGKSPLGITLNNSLKSPLLFVSNAPSQLEERIVPQEWNELGLQSKTRLNDWSIYAGVVSGLNSEFFRKYNWVGGGYQKQFENINADQLAYTAGVEWGDVVYGRGVSVHYYEGDTQKNRYKLDKLVVPAKVKIWTAMAQWKFFDRVGVVTEHIKGELENSEKIALANATLSGVAKPKSFAAVGAAAELQMYQLNVDVTEDVNIFAQEEHVNTFSEVEGTISADPRYEVNQKGYGFAYKMDEITYIKAHYYTEKTKLDSLPETKHFVLSLNIDTGEF